MLLNEDHIFTIKTKDPENVASILAGGEGIEILGLNVLKDQINKGDFVFLVLGGDKPKGWSPGFVGFAHISLPPYDEGYDGGKNFKVKVDVDVCFSPEIIRKDLVTYPDTYGIIGIAPITKWEPNQAITNVPRLKAIALIQAVCDLRPMFVQQIKTLLGNAWQEIEKPIHRYIDGVSSLYDKTILVHQVDLREKFRDWLTNVYLTDKGTHPKENAVNSYVTSVGSITDVDPGGGPFGVPLKSYWYELYRYLYGKLEKGIYNVSTKSEFQKIFGDLCELIFNGVKPPEVSVAKFDAVMAWRNDPATKKGSWVPSGLNRYLEFLEWQECNNLLPGKDLLSISLRGFASSCGSLEWSADSTDGDMSKPKPGYVVNKQLRQFLHDPTALLKLQADDPKDVRAWFKAYWNPDDSKDWLEGLSNDDLNGFGPYVSWIIAPAGPKPPQPEKFTKSLEAALWTIVKPEETCFYDQRVHEVLKFLGLVDDEFKADFSDDDYALAKSAQIVLKRRLKGIGAKRVVEWDATANPPGAKDDGADPDFLTVNEFLWFVKLNMDKISKECEVKKMKAADYTKVPNLPDPKKPKVDVGNAEQVVLLRLAAALRAKPFAILAGHSGTGKSRMVRQLAYMTCKAYKALREDAHGNPLKSPGNFCMVQVKPNWHDSTDLLGYYSELKSTFRATEFVKFICRAYAYPDVPFFVCLDEMNLAPVEQYFAEYLSAIESRKLDTDANIKDANDHPRTIAITDVLLDREVWKKASDLGCELNESNYWLETYGLTIPRNLFVVGTVNMDESTNQFSRKVLDRAFTLEMTDANFSEFGTKNPEPTFADYAGDEFAAALLDGDVMAKKPADNAEQEKKDLFAKQIKMLEKLKPVLADTSFVVAYRFANEYMLYENALQAMESVIEVTGLPSGTAPDSADGEGVTPTAEGAEGISTVPAEPKSKPDAFDDMVLMKVLPRITGDKDMVMGIFCGRELKNKNLTDAGVKGLAGLLGQKGASFKKMQEIVTRGESNGSGTLTFWP